jgi:hypothetical protein
MQYDFALVYYGLTRSVKKTHESQFKHIFDVLDKNNLTYKKFMHTWKTADDVQNVWENVISDKIDYSEYKLLDIDFYKLDDEDEFIESLNMDNYFYKDVWETKGHCGDGEWLPKLLLNHICALESTKRGFEMVENYISIGNTFKYIMFIRPDVTFFNDLPLHQFITKEHELLNIPNCNHHEGWNPDFVITNYENAAIYAKRTDGLIEFRKTNGRIVAEKYWKFIIEKHNMKVNELTMNYELTRP